MEPSPEEIQNGWDAESLTAYHAQREQETAAALDWTKRDKGKPKVQNSKYRRFR